MRPRPATEAALFVEILSHLPPLDGGRNFEPCRAHKARRIYPKPPQNRDPAVTKLLGSAVASGSLLLNERDGGGSRNARTTSTRLRAFLECSPAIHPRESPATAGPAAIIWRVQKPLTFSMNHSLPVRRRPQQQTAASLCRNCGG